VAYIPSSLEVDHQNQPIPKVRTDFYVSHDNIDTMRESAARRDRPWNLGDISPGEEWFACTFRTQPPAALSGDRLETILLGADRVWQDAYERMSLGESHAWRRHTDHETSFIIDNLGLSAGDSVLDIGSGDGRHAVSLSRRRLRVTAVDIVPALLSRGELHSAGVAAYALDARTELPPGSFDAVLMLYDVIGSSARYEDDEALLRNARRALRPGGHLVLSVMNTDATLPGLTENQLPQNDADFVTALEDLPPSNTMESTGNIFDPDRLVYYGGIYYRKEQFSFDEAHLPSEYVVRDRRYSIEELGNLLEATGFEVNLLIPVQSGAWAEEAALQRQDPRAKELLAVATSVSG
jgi:SAM-dependent methyltransferase